MSLQDEANSRGVSKGLSLGIGFGNTAEADAPKQVGRTSNSISANYQKSESERRWADEQSGIIGHDSIRIRANDTTLVGGLIANATRDDNGALVDRGNLDMQTETLTVQHLHDVDRSRTVGGSLGVSVSSVPASQAKGTESNGLPPQQDKNKTPAPVPHNTLTAGATYLGHDKVQATHATLGLGHIVVGGTTLTDDNAVHPGLGDLNRDLNLAQEITKDNDVGGLNFVTTIDLRLFSDSGLDDLLQEQKNAAGTIEKGVLAGSSTLISVFDKGDTSGGTLAANAYDISQKNAQLTVDTEAVIEGDAVNLVNISITLNALNDDLHNGIDRPDTNVYLAVDLKDDNGNRVAGLFNKADQSSIFIDASHMSDVVNTLIHENYHQGDGSEWAASAIGYLGEAAFNLGSWVNNDALARYRPTNVNPVIHTGFNDANSQLFAEWQPPMQHSYFRDQIQS